MLLYAKNNLRRPRKELGNDISPSGTESISSINGRVWPKDTHSNSPIRLFAGLSLLLHSIAVAYILYGPNDEVQSANLSVPIVTSVYSNGNQKSLSQSQATSTPFAQGAKGVAEAVASNGTQSHIVSETNQGIQNSLQYPPAAEESNIQGTVVITVYLETASQKQLSIETTSGFTVLDNAALAAVSAWAFDPKLVGQSFPLTIHFQLQ